MNKESMRKLRSNGGSQNCHDCFVDIAENGKSISRQSTLDVPDLALLMLINCRSYSHLHLLL